MAKYRVGGNSIMRVSQSATSATLINMTAYIDTVDGLGREFQSLDVTAFADAVERIIPGIESSQDFSFRGHFDDTSTGPHAIYSTLVGSLGTVEWSPIGTQATRPKLTTQAMLVSYQIHAEAKGRVEYVAAWKADGSMTVGTN